MISIIPWSETHNSWSCQSVSSGCSIHYYYYIYGSITGLE